MASTAANKLLKKLRGEDGEAHLRSLSSLATEYILDQKLSAFVDVARIVEGTQALLTGPGVEIGIARHLRPAIERQLARVTESNERLGASLSAESTERIAQKLSAPVRLPPALVRKVIGSQAIRETISMVMQESIARVMRSSQTGSGLGGAVGRGAGTLFSVGKSLLGGLGDELEKQIQKRGKEVIDSSMSVLQEKIVEKILSEDSARMMGKGNATFFRNALKQPLSLLKKLPYNDAIAEIPAVLAHNLQRPEMLEAIRSELQAALTAEESRSLREILVEAGMLERVKADSEAASLPHLQAFVASEAFENWLQEVMS